MHDVLEVQTLFYRDMLIHMAGDKDNRRSTTWYVFSIGLQVEGRRWRKKRYKARLVVKEFAQKKGIYFDEIISVVVKMTSIRTILSLVVVEDLHLEQLDVKTIFLHGDLEEEIYMPQRQGYEVKGK
jgi:hypothetical protein